VEYEKRDAKRQQALPPGGRLSRIPQEEFTDMNYAVSEFKLISDSPRRLRDFEEARGFLASVSCRDGCTVASFEWGSVAFPEEIREELAGLVGRTVAVLRLDDKYHVRAV